MAEYKWSLSSDPFPDWNEKDWSENAVKTKVQALRAQLCFVTDFVRQLDINMAKKVVKMDFTRATQALESKVKDGDQAVTWELHQALESRDKRVADLEAQLRTLQDEVRSGNEKLDQVGGERAILQKGTLEIVKKRVLEDLKKEVHIEANKSDISEYVESAVAKRMDAVKSKFSEAITRLNLEQSNAAPGGASAARIRRKIAKSHGIGSWRINELWKQMADPTYVPKELTPEEEEGLKVKDEEEEAEEEEAKQQALLLDRLAQQSSRMSTELDYLKSELGELREYASGSALHLQEEIAHTRRDNETQIANALDRSRQLADTMRGDIGSVKKEVWDSLSVLQIASTKTQETLSTHDLQYKELDLRVKQGLEQTMKEHRGTQRILDSAIAELKIDVQKQTTLTLEGMVGRVKALEDKSLRTDTTYWELFEKTKALTDDLGARFTDIENWHSAMSTLEDPRQELDHVTEQLAELGGKESAMRMEVDHLTTRLAEVSSKTEELDNQISQLATGRPESPTRSSTRPNSAGSRRSREEIVEEMNAWGGEGSGGQISSLQELYIALEDEIQAEANKRAVAFGDILRILVPFRQAVLAELAAKATYQDVEALVRRTLGGGDAAADADDVIFQWQQTQGIDSPRRWSQEPRSWSRCSGRSQDPVDSLYNVDLPRVNTKVTRHSSGPRPPSGRANQRTPRPPSARSHASVGSVTSNTGQRPTSAPGRRSPAVAPDSLHDSLTIVSAATLSSGGGSRASSAGYLP